MMKTLCIALSIYLCFILIPTSVVAYSNKAPSKKTGSITVRTKKEKGRNKCFEYELKIPIFQFKNKIFQKKLNTYYKEIMIKSKNGVETYYKEYGNMNEDCKDIEPTYFSKTNYKVTYNKTPIFSLFVLFDEAGGAAHDFLKLEGKTYDFSTSQELRSEDLFIKNSNI